MEDVQNAKLYQQLNDVKKIPNTFQIFILINSMYLHMKESCISYLVLFLF